MHMPCFPRILAFCAILLLPAPGRATEDESMAPPLSALQDMLTDEYGLDLAGFLEARYGRRLQSDPYEKDVSLAETRLQIELGKDLGWGQARLKGDLGWDWVSEEGITELREASFFFSPLAQMDVKLGRQTLTWGTGDLLFINDLFAKDWESFFTGRDDEYLKAPSDAVRISAFLPLANVDLVYMPAVTNSVFIDGSRLSYWNPGLGRTAGRDATLIAEERNSLFTDSELAARISRTVGGTEIALYAFHGFWKTPEGMDPLSGRLTYPRLNAYGASVRGNLLGGIANLEAGWYDSRDDRSGGNPFVRNSELRFLAGYERELAQDFTGGAQYYLEQILDHDGYLAGLAPGAPAADEYRHLLTLRLTRLLLDQNLRLSLFAYWSPSDRDVYLRPKASYKLSDHWNLEAGGNLFAGRDDHTFFGQFDRNTNLYAGARYSF